MKALSYERFGAADVLRWADGWEKPQPGAEDVLVRVVAGSVNPKDVLLRHGKFSRTLARDPLPRIAGLDMAGEVVAVGDSVEGLKAGDAVFGMTNRFSGGVHAEFACLPQSEVCAAPAGLGFAPAAAVPLAALTALQGLRDVGRLQAGHRLLIVGASGGVGHFAVQIAVAMGAEVHAVCGPHNVDFVASLGAHHTYSYAERPATAIAADFDRVFDVFGKQNRGDFAHQLGRDGIYVNTVPKRETLVGEALGRLGVWRGSRLVQVRSRRADLQQLKAWIEAGVMTPHVERVYPVGEAADAHRHVETRRTVGKVCIDFRA